MIEFQDRTHATGVWAMEDNLFWTRNGEKQWLRGFGFYQSKPATSFAPVAVTPAARTWLADHGYDPIYGARPLRRLMQQQIDDRLANLLLAGEIHDGSSVRVDVAEGGVELIVTPGADELE